jgi:hypothetical protein
LGATFSKLAMSEARARVKKIQLGKMWNEVN